MEWESIVLIALAGLALYLLTRRWFWVGLMFFAGLASLFSMIASIFHFQILAALGFFVLTGICWVILGAISE